METNSAFRTSGWGNTLACALGWFSVGLGLLQAVAPAKVARAAGLTDDPELMRAYGTRELAIGVGLLTVEDRAPWVMARVAGDLLDLGALATAVMNTRVRNRKAGLAMLLVSGMAVLDVWCMSCLKDEARRERAARYDYSDRSGMPAPAEAMRGAARDFEAPRDMRVPELMRAYTVQS